MTTITVPRAVLEQVLEQVLEALVTAEAGLADIGDADREQGDDVAWCEARAAAALEGPRAAITALRDALAQPLPDPVDEYRKGFIDGQIDMRDRPEEQEQEPVAWVDEASIAWLAEHPCGIITTRLVKQKSPERQMALYTAPPRREWQSLSEDEIWEDDRIMAENARCGLMMSDLSALARAIEAKLKEKNNG
jgi:hypothetical protein